MRYRIALGQYSLGWAKRKESSQRCSWTRVAAATAQIREEMLMEVVWCEVYESEPKLGSQDLSEGSLEGGKSKHFWGC